MMEWGKPNAIVGWVNSLIMSYSRFTKESKTHRCRIVEVKTASHDIRDVILLVMINGVKHQTISYSPHDLVMDDLMLREFSSSDVRAITFYALQKTARCFQPLYCVVGQDFMHGKTIFIIKKSGEAGEIRKTAFELYADSSLLKNFGYDDLKNIISTAIQEQTIDDLNRMDVL